jgi:hypothetical protein
MSVDMPFRLDIHINVMSVEAIGHKLSVNTVSNILAYDIVTSDEVTRFNSSFAC